MALVAGCAAGPDFQRPAKPEAKSLIREPLTTQLESSGVDGGETQHFVQDMDIPRQWWTLFHSETLNALVEQSLKANSSLQAAQAALRVAQENTYAQQGAYYPSVQAGISSNRQKIPGSIASPLNSGSQLFSIHTAQISVSYIPDVFGGNRRLVESLQAQADVQRFQLDAAYISLTANVVAAAVQEASLRAQIAATKEIILTQNDQLTLLKKQAEIGEIAEAAVESQDAALAQSEEVLPLLNKQLAQQRDLLAALTGHFPSDEISDQFELSSLTLPRELPLTLPSRLVDQRPDVRAAEAQLHAASAEIGVAIANMLPQLSLTGGGGSVATQLSQVFAAGTGFWSAIAGATQTIFQGTTLLHRKRAAQAAYDQAAAQYRSTVINAFQDVADTLYALQGDTDALRAALRGERAIGRNLEIARRQVEIGYISPLMLLNTEQAYHQAVLNRVQAQANRYADTAALFQALGGGWWHKDSIGLGDK